MLHGIDQGCWSFLIEVLSWNFVVDFLRASWDPVPSWILKSTMRWLRLLASLTRYDLTAFNTQSSRLAFRQAYKASEPFLGGLPCKVCERRRDTLHVAQASPSALDFAAVPPRLK